MDEAICFGWVDSQPRMLDADRSQRLLTPRRPGSNWSRINKQRVHRLTEAGLMAPAGLATVEAARRDGSWTTLDAVEDLTEPDDLAPALTADAAARRHWDTFPRSTRRAGGCPRSWRRTLEIARRAGLDRVGQLADASSSSPVADHRPLRAERGISIRGHTSVGRRTVTRPRWLDTNSCAR